MYVGLEVAMTTPTTDNVRATDDLSQLVHHRQFRDVLRDTLVPQAQESGDPLTLALVDIDHFSAINDTHGLDCGDAVLATVMQTVRDSMSDTAVIGRWGGDELCAALPDTRLDDAFTAMEALRRRVEDLTFPQWPDVHVTLSIGLATFPADGKADVELVRAADEALYVAKVTGRNKVSLPLGDSRMVTKTSYYTATQLERLTALAKTLKRNEASLLREALDDVLKKYNDQLSTVAKG
jgi:diguanylate cyclase (GGDEF)-like protein